MTRDGHISTASEPGVTSDKQGHGKGNGSIAAPATARGEATRRRILDAAETVFGEVGYYEASVSEITRKAGVAQGTFYIYFPSKREIFIELVEDIGKRLRAFTNASIAGATDRLDAERRGFAAFFEFVANHRRIYSIVQEAERVAPEAAHAYYQAISRGYVRALQKAMDAGAIRSMSAEGASYALMGIGHFVALRWLIWPQEGEVGQGQPVRLPDEVFDAVMDLIKYGLAKPADE